MAKYCTKCGKELKGKKCDCDKQEVEITEEIIEVEANEYVDTFINTLKGMFTKPIDTLKEFIQDDNFIVGGVAILINIVIMSIFLCLLVRESYAGLLFNYNRTNMNLFTYTDQFNIPYMRIFVSTLFICIVTKAAFAGLLYIFSDKIFEGKSSYKKMIALLGATSMITICSNLVAILFMYISGPLMMIALCIGLFLYIFYLYHGLKFASKADDNKLGYILMTSIMILFVILIFILPGIFG